MDHSSILADLKKKNYKPVYVLSGDEPYFIDLISDYIEKNVLDESEREFNQTVLYGRDVNAATIISEAKRYPMMSDKQVIIIKEAQNVKDIDELAAYAENPLDSTLLVLCYKYKTLDGRKPLKKVVTKKGVLFESEKLRDYKIPDWIAGFLREKKYSAEPKSLQLLTEYLGTDLGKIVNELEKLMINLPPGTEITPDHIQQNIGISKDFNTFELNDAIAKRDVVKANRIVNYFGSNSKDHPMPVTMGALFSFFVKVMQFHFATDKSRDAVAKVLGVHPFYVNDYVVAAKNFPLGKVRQAIGILREYDMRWKGVDNVTTDEGELLKEMVWKLIH